MTREGIGTRVAEINRAKTCDLLSEVNVVSKRVVLMFVCLTVAAALPIAAVAAPGDQGSYPPPQTGGQGNYPPPQMPAGGYAGPDASVRLEMKPKQAEVFVDGFYAGTVDDFTGAFHRLRLPPGVHEIEVYLGGYHTYREKIYLAPDATLKLRHELEKLGPNDEPEPRPQPIMPPPPSGGSTPPEPGYPPARPSQGRRLPPPPPPDTRESRPPQAGALGSLALHIQPGDAEVLIDGQRWPGPSGSDRPAIELPEGRHTIEVRKAGYRTYLTDVDVKRGETTPVEISLRTQGN
jgi:hypothetical protein